MSEVVVWCVYFVCRELTVVAPTPRLFQRTIVNRKHQPKTQKHLLLMKGSIPAAVETW